MKQTNAGGNFEVFTFYYIFFFKKTYFKISAKCDQQNMILTHQIFCVLNPWSL